MAETNPFDPTNIVDFRRQAATQAAVDTYDEEKVDPERAARAIELGRATGEQPGVIYEDLDNFEKQGKQLVAQNIIAGNTYIQDYINKYALASKVSSDDWGQLDEFTANAARFGPKSVMHKAFEAFKENFPREHLDEEAQRLEELMRQNPIFGNYFLRQALVSDARDIVGFMHGIGATVAGISAGAAEAGKQLGFFSEADANRLTRDLIVMANVAMSGQGLYRGPFTPGMHELQRIAKGAKKLPEKAPEAEKPSGVVIGGVEYPPEVFSESRKIVNKFEPYLRDGDPPPAHIDTLLEEFWKEQAKEDAKNLKSLEQSADASNTSQRVPDEFAEHFSNPATENHHVGVRVTAAADLLDELPKVAEQKDIAANANADIVIPVSEWLKLDPEIRDALRDHVRARMEGLTLDETKPKEGPEVQPGEPAKPQVPPDEAMYDAGLTDFEVRRLKNEPDATKIKQINEGYAFINGDWRKITDEDVQRAEMNVMEAVQETAKKRQKLAEAFAEKDRPNVSHILGSDWQPTYIEQTPEGYRRAAYNVLESHSGYAERQLAKYQRVFARGQETEAPARRPLPPEAGEPPPPKFLSGDNVVDALRERTGLEDRNFIQERKLNLTHVETELHPYDSTMFHVYDLVDDTGKRVGDLQITESRDGRNLTIEWVGAGQAIGEGIKAFVHRQPNGFGPRAIRDLLEQIRQEYPQARTISGRRVSGARAAAGVVDEAAEVKVPLRGPTYENLREFIETVPGWRIADTTIEPREPFLSHPPEANLTPTTFTFDHGGGYGEGTAQQIASYTVRQAIDHMDPEGLHGVSSALFQFLGERLKETVGDVLIRVVSREEMDKVLWRGRRDGTPGFYSPIPHEIILAEDVVNGVRGGEMYATHILMHEMGHAYTSRVISTDVRVARDIKAIMKDLEDYILTAHPKARAQFDYAFTNPSEFMAEAWGHPRFQELLSETPMSPKLAEALGMKGEKGTIWDAVRKIIGDLIQRLIGVRPENSILDGLMKIAERIEGRLTEAPEYLQPGEKFMEGREWIYDAGERLAGPPKEPELPMIGTTRLEDQPVFKQATAAGITAPMLKGWLKYIQRKFNEDNAAELNRIRADEARKQTKEWRENRAEVMKDASVAVYDLPDIKADELLRTGHYLNHKFGKFRLDPEGLTPEQKEAIPSAYLAKKFTKKEEIVTKDDLANMVGLDSGDILIERLAAIKSERENSGLEGKAYIDKLIKNETDKMMETKYGKLKENIQLNTLDRVINDTQLDYMHEYLVALAEQNKLEFSFTKAQIMEGLQRKFDEAYVGTIRSKDYLNHAGKAVRGMTEQFIKENPAEAFKKQHEHFFATVTAKIAGKFELQMEDLKDTAKKFVPDIRKGVNQEYTNQVHRLLHDAGFPVHRTRPEIVDAIQKDSPGRESLKDFIEDKKLDGWEIDAPDWLDEGGNIPKFKNMTNGQATEFKELIDSLEHIGRAVEKIEVAGEARDFLEWKKMVINTIKQLPERPEESQGRWLWQIDSSMTRMEEMIKDLDLRQELGPLFNAVIVPMMRSKAKEFDLVTDLSNYFKEVRGAFDHKWRKSLNDDIPQDFIINPYNDAPYKLKRSNLINIMLNWGNPSNRWKFSAGYASRLLGRKAKPEEIAQFEAKTGELIRDFATKQDWDYVQAMWVPFKKWQPMMDVVARNTTGVSPRWIQGDIIKTPYGDIEGGYWPVKYSRYTNTFDLVAEKEDAPDRLFSRSYFPAATSKGHLKERTRFIDAVDINTSMEQAAGVMQQTIHDIAFRDALIQVNKIFRDEGIKKAATNHYGQEYVEQWMPWLKRIANKNVVDEAAMKGWNRYQNAIRVNLIGHALPLSIRVILSPDVGALNPKAVAAFNSNRAANVKFVMETSDEVRHLVYNIDRDFREQMEKISTRLDWSAFQRRAVQFGFAPVMKASQDFRMVTFYDKFHEAKAAGRSDAEAKTIADYFVRSRHGAASVVDLPAVMASSETWKSVTMFYSFFNMTQNWQRQIPGNIRRGELSKAAVNFYGSVLISAAFGALLFNQAKESDSWFKIIGKALALQPLMGIPLLGPAANWWFEGFQPRTPHEGIVNAAFDIIMDVEKVYSGKPLKHPIRHLANMIGIGTGLPLAQIGRTGEFFYDVYTGEQRPRDFVDWARGIISGEARLKP